MSNYQNQKVKFISIFLIFFLANSYVSNSQTVKDDLFSADSLFVSKKYMESYQLYHKIYEKGYFTPSMLLRMAFIKEGLGDYTRTLFYLNQYYLKTSDRQTLEKMEKLAKKNKLQGYYATDFDFFATMYYRYHFNIILALAAAIILMFSVFIYYKRKQQREYASLTFMLLFSITLFIVINFGQIDQKGIIAKDHVFLMSAPSAGAEFIQVIQKGHRVNVIGKHDVWQKIKWNDKIVYIKEDQILRVN